MPPNLREPNDTLHKLLQALNYFFIHADSREAMREVLFIAIDHDEAWAKDIEAEHDVLLRALTHDLDALLKFEQHRLHRAIERNANQGSGLLGPRGLIPEMILRRALGGPTA